MAACDADAVGAASVLGKADVLCAPDEECELPHKSLYTDSSKSTNVDSKQPTVRSEMAMLECRWILFCFVAPGRTALRGERRVQRKNAPAHG